MVSSNKLRFFGLFTVFGLVIQSGAVGPVLAGDVPWVRLYCCIDATGKQACGDTLPRGCYGRAYREIGPNGLTIREVAAPLTAEQRAQRAREDEQRKQEEILQKEQARKDQALLNTYGSLEELDFIRERALNEALSAIKKAEEAIEATHLVRKKFEDEAEFYKNKTLPADVDKGLRDTEFEIKTQEAIIATRRKEIETLRVRFDEDRKRFIELRPPTKPQPPPP